MHKQAVSQAVKGVMGTVALLTIASLLSSCAGFGNKALTEQAKASSQSIRLSKNVAPDESKQIPLDVEGARVSGAGLLEIVGTVTDAVMEANRRKKVIQAIEKHYVDVRQLTYSELEAASKTHTYVSPRLNKSTTQTATLAARIISYGYTVRGVKHTPKMTVELTLLDASGQKLWSGKGYSGVSETQKLDDMLATKEEMERTFRLAARSAISSAMRGLQ